MKDTRPTRSSSWVTPVLQPNLKANRAVRDRVPEPSFATIW